MAETQDPLREEYISILKDLRSTAQEGKEFVTSQAPLVAQEIVTARMVESAVPAGISAVLLVPLFLLYVGIMSVAVREVKSGKETMEDNIGPMLFVTAVTGVLGLVLSGIAITHAADIAKCIYAPRVVVIEEIGNLIK